MKKIIIVALVILVIPSIAFSQDEIKARSVINLIAKGVGYLVLFGLLYLLFRLFTKKSK